MTTTPAPNAEHIQVWEEIIAPKFERFRAVFVASADAHSRVAFERLSPRRGERVLDIGCGFGETSIDLARRVGPQGRVLAIDPCRRFLEVARADGAAAGVKNVIFEQADAQTRGFEPEFDFLFSRFGLMFFANPVAALRNQLGALRPGKTLLTKTRRPIEDHTRLALPKQIALRHVPPPDDSAPSGGPGPFSMASPDTVRTVFGSAGFANLTLTRVDVDMQVGRTVEEAIEAQLQLGPAGEVMRVGGALAEAKRPQVVAELKAALAQFQRKEGIFMPSSSWCITGNRPA
jgi:ubiquinone/menaquinone biosynthesis C-methylase UbiE